MKNKQHRKYLIYLLAIIALGALGALGWKYYQTTQNSPEALAAKAEAEKSEILTELSKQMILPEGDPVLFKVSNEEVMRSQQAFFKDTKNDDVLLVYQQSGKAVLYRPSNRLIVNAGPVNFDTSSSTAK